MSSRNAPPSPPKSLSASARRFSFLVYLHAYSSIAYRLALKKIVNVTSAIILTIQMSGKPKIKTLSGKVNQLQIKPIRLLKIPESLIVYVLNNMGGHIIQKWYECSIDDRDHDRYD